MNSCVAVRVDLLREKLDNVLNLKMVDWVLEFCEPVVAWRFNCVQCSGMIEMLDSELNCRIIRHGHQLLPHANKQTCNEFSNKSKQIVGFEAGCGQPMRFAFGIVSACDYI